MNFKKDFPLFSKHPEIIYLDSAATAQKPAHVIDGMKDFMEHSYANIHRGAYSLSEKSEEIYDTSKEAFAKLINASASEIIYTYNATYAFNLLVQSLTLSGKLQAWDKILLGIAEHHANIVPWQISSKFEGIEIEWINIDEQYDIDFVDFEKKYTSNVKVVSLSAVSNVTWKIYNIKNIKSLLRDDTLFVVDASQALSHLSLDVKELWCDALIATGHKMMTDTGIGMLYMTAKLIETLTPSIGGGGSIEDVSTDNYNLKHSSEKFEPGTPHLIGALSLLKAVEYIESIGGYEAIQKHENTLITHALHEFTKRADNITLIWPTSADDRIGVFSFTVNSFPNHIQLGELLAQKNICVRSGAHCTHPFFKQIEKNGSCRMSLYLYNTIDDIDIFFATLDEIIS